MRIINSWQYLMLALSFFIYASQGNAETGQPDIIRIVVEQSYSAQADNVVDDIRLPFESITQRLLANAGVKVATSDIEESDFILKIQSNGQALGKEYNLTGRGKGTFYHTGASLSGEISFEQNDSPIHTVRFYGRISPPSRITSGAIPSPQSLFEKLQRDYFVPNLIKAIGERYSTQFFIATLEDSDVDIQQFAAKELKESGEIAIEPLIMTLQNENFTNRGRVAEILGQLHNPRAVEPLIEMLNDTNAEFRASIASALGRIKDARAVIPLINAFQTEKVVMVRENMIEALGRLQDPRAVQSLISEWKDLDHPEIHGRVMWALTQIGDPTTEPLVAALTNESPSIRKNAAETLGVIKASEATEPLIHMLKDENSDIRKTALEALKKITMQSFGEDYELWIDWWKKRQE